MVDAVGVGAHEAQGAGLEPLDPLGGLAEHEHGLAQRRCLLLHAPGVGDDEVRATEQLRERRVAERLGEQHVGAAAELVAEDLAHTRVRMHREHEVDVGLVVGDARDALTDAGESVAPVLAPVRGDR